MHARLDSYLLSGVWLTMDSPLPKWQLAIVYGIQLIEPLSGTVILPWLPDCIRRTGVTGGQESKVGYYSGIIGSVFFVTECLTVVFWGRASDVYGRRPILLLGMQRFLRRYLPLRNYFVRSNWTVSFSLGIRVIIKLLVADGIPSISRIFNGNIGVAKTVLAELVDSRRIGDVYALMPVMWGLGNAIGPVLGGVLANPAERWPSTFGKLALFQEYPYLLPCGVAAMLSLSIFITNYGWLFFLSMGYTVLIPLMYSTPISEGGLGFTPYKIGVIMATWGQDFAPFGERRVFIASAVVFFAGTFAFSFESFFAKLAGKVDALVWMLSI
ncbi:hypothetical protein BDZ89DRAFT_1107678 [Hymenopellis radicata]|nr:hypothetical protein BDZ89DRAFT_1107678 [Hymenopellis radicata]